MENKRSSNPPRKIVNLLSDLATKSRKENKKLHTFAAVCYKNSIIAIGNNCFKTDPFQQKFGRNPQSIYLHAEILAIKRALKILDSETLKKCDIVVVRATDKGLGCSKPCSGCYKAIVTFGLKNIYHS